MDIQSKHIFIPPTEVSDMRKTWTYIRYMFKVYTSYKMYVYKPLEL